MGQTNELDATYAAIAETKEKLFEMLSKKLSMNKDLESTMARVVSVS